MNLHIQFYDMDFKLYLRKKGNAIYAIDESDDKIFCILFLSVEDKLASLDVSDPACIKIAELLIREGLIHKSNTQNPYGIFPIYEIHPVLLNLL